MPPQFPAPRKPYFFYGHKTPSQNRPTVYGGLFSNRQTIDPKDPNYSLNPRDLKVQKSKNPKFADNFKLKNWDPDSISTHKLHPSPNPSEKFFLTVQNLSPLARFICDSIRKHKRWGPPIIEDLCKLRRVTPFLVAEVLKVQSDPVPCLQSPLNPNPSTATSHHHRNNHHGGMQQFLQNFLDHPLPPHRAKNPTPPTLQTSDAASLSLSCPDHTPAGKVNNNNPHRGSHHSSFSSSFARSVPQQLMGPAARRASFSFLSPFEEGCGVSAGHSSFPSSQQVDNDPRRKRIMKNRESAARSRARRQAYTYELERERAMLIEENARLRHKLREQDHQSVGSVAAVPAPPQQTPKKKCLSRTISASF